MMNLPNLWQGLHHRPPMAGKYMRPLSAHAIALTAFRASPAEGRYREPRNITRYVPVLDFEDDSNKLEYGFNPVVIAQNSGGGIFGGTGLFDGEALGWLGAAGSFTFFAKFQFTEAWSFDDFQGTSGGWQDRIQSSGMSWDPPSAALRSQAEDSWNEWTIAAGDGDMDAQRQLDRWTADLKTTIRQVDALTKQGDIFAHRSDTEEQQRIAAMTRIKRIMQEVANAEAPAPKPRTRREPTTTERLPTRTLPGGAADLLSQQQPGGGGRRQFTPSDLMITPKAKTPWLTIGLGVGALAIAGAFVAFRKR